jgi:hypothetical protein
LTFSSCLRPHYRADDKSRSKEKAKGREYNEATRKDNSTLPNQELMTFGDTETVSWCESRRILLQASYLPGFLNSIAHMELRRTHDVSDKQLAKTAFRAISEK